MEAKLSVSLLVGFEFCVSVVFPARSKHTANDVISFAVTGRGIQHADSQSPGVGTSVAYSGRGRRLALAWSGRGLVLDCVAVRA